MKKLLTAVFFCLCLAGCGNAPYYEYLSYTLLDDSSESARASEIEDFANKFNMTGGRVVYRDDIESGERIDPPDTEKFLAGMDRVTDDIFASNEANIDVYRDKEYKNYLLVCGDVNEASDYYTESTNVYLRTEEYAKLTENTEKRTGLIYSGTKLGKDYLKPFDFKSSGTFSYTGKNTLAFANTESILDSMYIPAAEDCVYKNAPLQVVLFMDKDEVNCVYIYWKSGNFAPALSKTNLKQLDINDTYGGAAQELVSRFFNVKNETSGTYNGIKYKFRQIKCKPEELGRAAKLLILE